MMKNSKLDAAGRMPSLERNRSIDNFFNRGPNESMQQRMDYTSIKSNLPVVQPNYAQAIETKPAA